MTFETYSSEETFELGKKYGIASKALEVYALSGDLGVGKTVFTKGFAEGLGINDPITSPTFTIVQEYRSGRIPLFHFDAYRIADPDEMLEIGFDEYLDSDGVCLIEWPENIEDILPENIRRITIEKDLNKGIDYRRIIIN